MGCKNRWAVRIMEVLLATNSKEAQDRAEASFKRKEQRARDGAKATAEYEAAGVALRKKTARIGGPSQNGTRHFRKLGCSIERLSRLNHLCQGSAITSWSTPPVRSTEWQRE